MRSCIVVGLLVAMGGPRAGAEDGMRLAAPAWQFVWFDTEVVRAVAVSPRNPDVIFASTGDALFRSLDRGASFSQVRSGFHYAVFDPFDSTRVYGLLSTGSRSDGIWVSDDLGDSWNVVSWNPFPTALILLRPGEMMLGTRGGGVFRRADSTASWTSLNAGLTDLNVLSLCLFDPTDSSPTVLAGTGHGIFRLPLSDTVWAGSTCPELPVRSLASTSWGEPLYAAVGSGTYSDAVYRSKDFGKTWQYSNWAYYPSSVVINHLDPKTVYAADSADGVFVTRDDGATWSAMNEGLANLVVMCLGQSARDTSALFAGNYAGLWRRDFGTSVEEPVPVAGIQVSVPTPSRGRIAVRYFLPAGNRRVDISVYDAKGALVERQSPAAAPGWHTLELAPAPAGSYFCRFRAGRIEVTKKIVVLDSDRTDGRGR